MSTSSAPQPFVVSSRKAGRALRDDTKNTTVSTEILLELRSSVRLVSVTELQVRRKLLYFPPAAGLVSPSVGPNCMYVITVSDS